MMKGQTRISILQWYLIIILIIGIFIVPEIQLFAEDEDMKLKDVVVTATRNEKSADEVTSVVEIVTEDEIKSAPANNVDDILRQLGGVDIRRPSDCGITSPLDISIRGVGGTKRVLFQVDGVPINSSLTGFVYPNQIQTNSIERMEVVKGAFSSLYGSNAMGGVINLITKERKTEGVDVTPMIKFGNYQLFETGFTVAGRDQDLAYTFNAGHRKVGNHYRRDTNVEYSVNFATREFAKETFDVGYHANYDDDRFFGKIAYDISDKTKMTVSANYAQANTEMGYTSYQPELRGKNTKYTFYFINANSSTVLNDFIDLETRVYTNYNESTSNTEHIVEDPQGTMGGMGGGRYSPIYGTRYSWGRDTGVQLKAGMSLAGINQMIIGVDSNFMDGIWENKKEDGVLLGDKMDESINNQAVYLQNETTLFQNLVLALGIRYDINSKSDNALSPKLGLLYKFGKYIRFRGSIGRAYRAPNLNELYTPTWMMIPGIPFESNPDLDPEYILSYDLGTTVTIINIFKVTVTGFYSQAEDLISNPITGGIMRYENIDEVETKGVEAGLRVAMLPWLYLNTNYTYTHSLDKESNEKLDDMPLHQGNGSLNIVFDILSNTKLTGSLFLRYNGVMRYRDRMTKETIDIDEWIVADLGLRLDLYERAGIQAALTNILNEEYEIHGSNLGPERCYWAAFDYTF